MSVNYNVQWFDRGGPWAHPTHKFNGFTTCGLRSELLPFCLVGRSVGTIALPGAPKHMVSVSSET